MDRRTHRGWRAGSPRLGLAQRADDVHRHGLHPSFSVSRRAHHRAGRHHHTGLHRRPKRHGPHLSACRDLHAAHHRGRCRRGSAVVSPHPPGQSAGCHGGRRTDQHSQEPRRRDLLRPHTLRRAQQSRATILRSQRVVVAAHSRSRRHRPGKDEAGRAPHHSAQPAAGSAGPAVHAHQRPHLDPASWHPGLCRPAQRTGVGRCGRRVTGPLRGCHPRGQRAAVLHRAATLSAGTWHQPLASPWQDDASRADGLLHQEFRRYPASHHGDSRETGRRGTESGTLRAAHLHHHQHERLRRVHPRHLALRHAERWHAAHPAYHAAVARHRRDSGHRQCRCAHGLLLPHPLADDRSRGTRRHHGHHPAHLYHHRYGGDS